MNGPLDNDADAFIADLVGGSTGSNSADPFTAACDLLSDENTVVATVMGVPLRAMRLGDGLVLLQIKNPFLTTMRDMDAASVMTAALEIMVLCQAGRDPVAIRSVFTDAAVRKNAVMQLASRLPANGMAGIITEVDAFVKQATETQVSAKSPTEGAGSSAPGND